MFKICSIRNRVLYILIPVCFFFLQSFFIYFDRTGYELVKFTELASKGKEVWHKNNCQSCHQLYGFGGFLGPDLTNRGKDFLPDALQSILALGPFGMPSIYVTKQESLALYFFFLELHTTGKSQPISSNFLKLSELPWFTYVKFQKFD